MQIQRNNTTRMPGQKKKMAATNPSTTRTPARAIATKEIRPMTTKRGLIPNGGIWLLPKSAELGEGPYMHRKSPASHLPGNMKHDRDIAASTGFDKQGNNGATLHVPCARLCLHAELFTEHLRLVQPFLTLALLVLEALPVMVVNEVLHLLQHLTTRSRVATLKGPRAPINRKSLHDRVTTKSTDPCHIREERVVVRCRS